MNSTPPTGGWGWWHYYHPGMQHWSRGRWGGWSEEAAAKAAGSVGAAAGSGAGAAAGAGSHLAHGVPGGPGGIPPHGYRYGHDYWHHHNPYRFRRFGVMRRFMWFGIGAGVATWWIRAHDKYHEDRQAYWHQQVDSYTSNLNNNQSGRHYPSFSNSYHSPSAPNPNPASGNNGLPGVDAGRPASAETVAAALALAAEREREEREKRWRWRGCSPDGRRGRLSRSEKKKAEADAEATAAAAAAAAAAEQPQPQEPASVQATSTPAAEAEKEYGLPNDEIARLRFAAEKMWEQRAEYARDAQTRANEKAREYARDRLDSLAATLDKLRDSLNEGERSKAPKRDRDEKLV